MSPNSIVKIPSPMLGRWMDTKTNEIIYLKEDAQLVNLELKELNLLKYTNEEGRYLIRAGFGDVKIFGTIKKISANDTTLNNLTMSIKHSKSGLIQSFKLQLTPQKDKVGAFVPQSNGENILYVEGNATHYTLKPLDDGLYRGLKVLTGTNEITIEQGGTTTSFVREVEDCVYDFGTLNITDESIGFKVVASLKEGNDYIYYGYNEEEAEDKPISYTKTLKICNQGSKILSSAQIKLTPSNASLFKSFEAKIPAISGIEAQACLEIPLSFAFNKPSTPTTIHLSIVVTSTQHQWENHCVMNLSDNTFVKLYRISKDTPLNGFVVIPDEARVFAQSFAQDTLSYIALPKEESKKYQLVITKQSQENPYMLTLDQTPNIKELENEAAVTKALNNLENDNNLYYIDGVKTCQDQERIKAFSLFDEISAEVLAIAYGKGVGYISYDDIDFFGLGDLPVPTHRYSQFGANGADKIIIPMTFAIDATNLDSHIKLFQEDGTEVMGLNKSFDSASKSIVIAYDSTKLNQTNYTIKLLKGLTSIEGDKAPLMYDDEWSIKLIATNLVATGQSVSYTNNDDGSYQTGRSPLFVRNTTTSSVEDKNTKLIWQDDNDTQSVTKNYKNAVAYCEDLVTSASSDWRLPTREELLTLVDYGKIENTIHDAFTFQAKNATYITATQVANQGDFTWLVDFESGKSSFTNNNSLIHNVRCVSGANAPIYTTDYAKALESDYVVERDDTYLLWQDDLSVASSKMSWEDAVEYCENLNLKDENNQYTGRIWRLPNIKELALIIDDTVSGTSSPAIKKEFENSAVSASDRYWSSTTLRGDSTQKWGVGFEFGIIDTQKADSLHHVRCVSQGSLESLKE